MHGPRPIPRGEHTTKTFDDDLIARIASTKPLPNASGCLK